MSILDIFKATFYKNELLKSEQLIARLEKDITTLEATASTCSNELSDKTNALSSLDNEFVNLNDKYTHLSMEYDKLKSVMTTDHGEALNVIEEIATLKAKKESMLNELYKLEQELKAKEKRSTELSAQIIYFEDEILYQSFSLYQPIYSFATSDEYKDRIAEIRNKQKELIKGQTAAICKTEWTVNGSKAQGKKQTNDNIKQILRSFNTECENAISSVKFNNYESMQNRIKRAFDALNKLNETSHIFITHSYLQLKYEELDLAYEYQEKKQAEKDEMRLIREQQKEDARLAKELEERRKEIEKERLHYENLLKRLNEQIENELSEEKRLYLIEKRNDAEGYIDGLATALKEVDYREANQRAGYVYVISNIGAFGDNVYKIGMTRRLDPQERIEELGNASVPFKFDVHAMIFSDDAPKLEASLHRAFDDKKINMVNNRKEFFKVSLEEIENVIKANHDKTVEFIRLPEAQQYRESLKARESQNSSNTNEAVS